MATIEILETQLTKEVEKVVKGDGIKPEAILPYQSEESVTEHAVREIVANILDFDRWYFGTPSDIIADERYFRILDIPEGASAKIELIEAIRKTVEFIIEDIRKTDTLDIDPNIEKLVGRLVDYTINWQDWYYEFKADQDIQNQLYDAGLNDDIYLETRYGSQDKSQGWSNIAPDDPEKQEIVEPEPK